MKLNNKSIDEIYTNSHSNDIDIVVSIALLCVKRY
jgi:hypothetical protein